VKPLWKIEGRSHSGNLASLKLRAADYAEAVQRAGKHRLRIETVAMVDEDPEATRARCIRAWQELGSGKNQL
jgi:hypothetical protein